MKTNTVLLNVTKVANEMHSLIDTQLEMIMDKEYREIRYVNGRLTGLMTAMKLLAEFMEK